MCLGATVLGMQALKSAKENFRVLIFPLVFTTLFNCCFVYRKRKYAKILLLVENYATDESVTKA